jgi:hypothetical protein
MGMLSRASSLVYGRPAFVRSSGARPAELFSPSLRGWARSRRTTCRVCNRNSPSVRRASRGTIHTLHELGDFEEGSELAATETG